MKMIGAHVCSQAEIESHEYQAGDSNRDLLGRLSETA